MNPRINVTNLTILLIGLLLLYAAIKDVDPRVVIKNGLKGKPTTGTTPPATPPATPPHHPRPKGPGTNPNNGVAV